MALQQSNRPVRPNIFAAPASSDRSAPSSPISTGASFQAYLVPDQSSASPSSVRSSGGEQSSGSISQNDDDADHSRPRRSRRRLEDGGPSSLCAVVQVWAPPSCPSSRCRPYLYGARSRRTGARTPACSQRINVSWCCRFRHELLPRSPRPIHHRLGHRFKVEPPRGAPAPTLTLSLSVRGYAVRSRAEQAALDAANGDVSSFCSPIAARFAHRSRRLLHGEHHRRRSYAEHVGRGARPARIAAAWRSFAPRPSS